MAIIRSTSAMRLTPDLTNVWHVRRWVRELRHHPREQLLTLWLQNAWFLTPIPAHRIGSGPGLLSVLRQRRHARRHRVKPGDRPLRITLLEDAKTGSGFAAITAQWINERSKACTAMVNTGIETADVLWIQTQDPMSHSVRQRFLALIARAPAARVLNHPDAYNAYHESGAFERLERGEVRVPRSRFGASDLGTTQVVYKLSRAQAAPKIRVPYDGEKPGHRAFEFIDSRGYDGRHTRYRAFYLAGAVRPSKVMHTSHWNVCLKNDPVLEFTFELTRDETEQIHKIAATLHLDYFAVDFIRRHPDGLAYFIDINVYPTVEALSTTGRSLGYYGRWHTFDTRLRLGIAEPGGREFPEVFDEAMLRLKAAPVNLW